MSSTRSKALKYGLISTFLVCNLLLGLFVVDMALTTSALMSQPLNDTVPVGRWGINDDVTGVEFQLVLNLPNGGFIQKSAEILIRVSISAQEDTTKEFFEFGNSYEIFMLVPLDSVSQPAIIGGEPVPYTVELVIVPFYLNNPLNGSMRYLKYSAVIQ